MKAIDEYLLMVVFTLLSRVHVFANFMFNLNREGLSTILNEFITLFTCIIIIANHFILKERSTSFWDTNLFRKRTHISMWSYFWPRRIVGFFFLIVLSGCWLAGQANSGHVVYFEFVRSNPGTNFCLPLGWAGKPLTQSDSLYSPNTRDEKNPQHFS